MKDEQMIQECLKVFGNLQEVSFSVGSTKDYNFEDCGETCYILDGWCFLVPVERLVEVQTLSGNVTRKETQWDIYHSQVEHNYPHEPDCEYEEIFMEGVETLCEAIRESMLLILNTRLEAVLDRLEYAEYEIEA